MTTRWPRACRPTAASTTSRSAPPMPRSGWKKTTVAGGGGAMEDGARRRRWRMAEGSGAQAAGAEKRARGPRLISTRPTFRRPEDGGFRPGLGPAALPLIRAHVMGPRTEAASTSAAASAKLVTPSPRHHLVLLLAEPHLPLPSSPPLLALLSLPSVICHAGLLAGTEAD